MVKWAKSTGDVSLAGISTIPDLKLERNMQTGEVSVKSGYRQVQIFKDLGVGFEGDVWAVGVRIWLVV